MTGMSVTEETKEPNAPYIPATTIIMWTLAFIISAMAFSVL
jgi:hypothetical protein